MTKASKRRRPKRKPARVFVDAGNERIVTELGEIDFTSRTISNSGRSTFLNCKQKFLLDYVYRLKKRGLKHYFWAGSTFHDELERMYLRGKFNKKAFKKRINRKAKEGVKLCTNPYQEDDIWKASAVLMGLVPAYAKYYLEEDLKHYKILSSEAGFELPIPGTDWSYVGFCDLIVKAKRKFLQVHKGDLILVENKSTSQLDTNYIAKLPLDNQIIGYCWGMRDALNMGTPDWVLYNASLKTRLRQKRDETMGQYLDRIEGDYLADPTKYFYRELLQFSDYAIDSFVLELSQWVIQDLEGAIYTRFFSKNTGHCTDYGMCDFMQICAGAAPLEESLLFFERKELSPREINEKANEQ